MALSIFPLFLMRLAVGRLHPKSLAMPSMPYTYFLSVSVVGCGCASACTEACLLKKRNSSPVICQTGFTNSSLVGKATGANAANEALGNLYIKQGQYDRAVNAFGDAKTNSAAQAQILAKDYNKAKATLSAIKNPDAMTDYLMAIVGARTNNASLVSSSIKSAIAKDASMAQRAANDREFAKFADSIK